MSHHKLAYRIYPTDDEKYTDAQWAKADMYLNGMETRFDFKEAVAFAQLCALNAGIPFIVQEVPLGGKRPDKTWTWEICDD